MSEIFLFASSSLGILILGFLLDLKLATEADHLTAVSTITSERKSLFGSTIIGGQTHHEIPFSPRASGRDGSRCGRAARL